MLCVLIAIPLAVCAQTAKPAWQADWDRTIELAKKEGKVVVSLPASAELRAGIEKLFEKRYGIDVEPIVGRASMLVRKMIDESKAGVRYIDLHMGGSESVVTGMSPEGVVSRWNPTWCCLKSEIPNSGGAVISRSITRKNSSTPPWPISRKVSGSIPN